MKANRIILILSILVMLGISSCTNQSANDNKMSKEKEIYTCSMHPEVVSEKPGSCPKCGMGLVKAEMPADTVNQMAGDSMTTMKKM